VGFAAGSSVTSVKVYPRQDALADRLASFQVWVGTHEGDISSAATGSLALCATATASGTSQPTTVNCASPLPGSFVTIRLPGAGRTLSLSEVVVTGTPPAPVNTITPISAFMQNTFSAASFPGHSFAAGQVIDGIIGTSTSWNFCLGVPGSTSPWLSIAIPVGSSVSAVEVYPRQDALFDRLASFQVWVGTHSGDISLSTPGSLALCGTASASTTSNLPTTVTCSSSLPASPGAALYVTIRLPGVGRTLSLSEVKIHGTQGSG